MIILDAEHYSNPDLHSLVTPLNVGVFKKMLEDADYDPGKREFLIDGFNEGFDIGMLDLRTEGVNPETFPWLWGHTRIFGER